MRTLIKNGTVVSATESQSADVLIDGETIVGIAGSGQHDWEAGADEIIDASGRYVIPGAIDVHMLMAGMYLRRGWRAHGVQRVLFLDKRLRIDEEPQRRAALTALARDHRSMDPELERLAATG